MTARFVLPVYVYSLKKKICDQAASVAPYTVSLLWMRNIILPKGSLLGAKGQMNSALVKLSLRDLLILPPLCCLHVHHLSRE